MTKNITAPNAATIHERAMLATLSLSRWTAIKEDKRVTKQVAADNNADASMGRYLKRLVVKQALKKIQVIAYRARHYHRDHTLPWTDGGTRLLPTTSYFEYMKDMNALKHQYEKEVGKFVADYDKHRREAKRLLGDLFNPDEYPASVEELQKMFKFTHEVNQLAKAADFRVDLDEETQAKIRADIEKSLNEKTHAAVLDSWRQVYELVQHLIAKLRDYNPDDKIASPFRDSVVDNVRTFAGLLPRLNVTGSAELDTMAKRLEAELCQVEPARLREDAVAREDVAAKADAILKDVSDVLG